MIKATKKSKASAAAGEGFPAGLSAPARRALEGKGIRTVEDLAGYTEKEVLALHGMGKGSMPKLREVLKERGLRFKG